MSEVHPFADGNGRLARAVMNAELFHAGELYARTLAFAWRWTAAMTWSDPPTTSALMERTNGLLDSTEAATTGQRLLLPGDRRHGTLAP